ncbi:ABC1 kinase family protein [Halovenus sp. HT40]|uniref:ABC1 kinase family protein n=1 Tax=Halovenus sp. HT40 TaxID=3126691 RepID=UPI00300F0B93
MNPRAYWRFVIVIWQFFPLIVAYLRDRRRFLIVGGPREVSSAQRRTRAKKLLNSLLTLGPTFIKLGQLLSTRPDVLPPEYIAEFSKLQDEVPPAEWSEAEQVLEEELGPLSEAFAEFDRAPISGASLGQVYRAQIDGQDVAVKVRRPGIEELVEADLRVIRWSLPILMRFVEDARSFSLKTLADEFDKTIHQEMDYEREGEMLERIRENFADNDSVRIPQLIESHSTGRVLTMEYVGGTKINDLEELDAKRLDRSELATTLQETYLQMIVEDGIFHADPHPGNLAVADDGTLIFYDFGMSGFVDPFVQDRIVDFYTAVARQDIDAILDTLVEMGTLSPEADRDVMADVMEIAIADVRGEEVEQYRVQQIIEQVEDTIYEFPLRLPSNLALVLRVATVVEGVCVTLDPEFDFISVATDYLRKQGYLERGAREFVTDRVQEVGDAATSAVRVPPKLESTLDRMQRNDLRVKAELEDDNDYLDRLAKRMIFGMLFTAGTVSATLLYIFESVPAALAAVVPTAVVGFLLYRSFTKDRGFSGQPQFTRQRMREREGESDSDAVGLGEALGGSGAGGADGPSPTGTPGAESGSQSGASGSTIPVEERENSESDER